MTLLFCFSTHIQSRSIIWNEIQYEYLIFFWRFQLVDWNPYFENLKVHITYNECIIFKIIIKMS